jgi:predicted nucleic acid-binding protein
MPRRFWRPYLDSSVYIAAIKGEVAEPGKGDTSAELLQLASQTFFSVFASVFVLTEVLRAKGHPPLSLTEEKAIDRYLAGNFITWVEVDIPLARQARDLARQYSLKPVDAVHLSSAIRAGADQLLAWDGDFPFGQTIEGVLIERPHLTDWPAQLSI